MSSERDRGYSRNKERDRNRDRGRESYYGSEVKSQRNTYSHHGHSGASSSSRDFEKRRSSERDNFKRKKHKRSRSPPKHRNRRSPERDRRHHRDKSTSRSPLRRYDDERSGRDYKNKDSGRRNHQRSRSHSRSTSRERERAREKNKQDVKLQMQRNYEEQLEKMRNAATLQPTVPLVQPVNQASRLVEQIQQRKALFSKKPEEVTKLPAATTLWKQPTFSDDADGKMSAKFKRLMGMKDDTVVATPTPSSSKESEVVKKQQQYFEDLEKQYEVARMTTHTQRGLGLGFGSSSSSSLR